MTRSQASSGSFFGSRSAGLRERAIHVLLAVCALVSVAVTAGILLVLGIETVAFFGEVSPMQVFGDTMWTPLFADARFGIWPLIWGTVLTSAIAMMIALPFGLGSALYLSEFAGPRARRVLKPLLEVLAGVPTVVYGYFALVLVTPLLQLFVPGLSTFNALAPGLVMGIMIVPTVGSLSEDALSAVPVGVREAAYGVGAGRAATVFRVLLPSAASGVVAACILGVSRAVGETMIVTIAAGQQPRLTFDPRDAIQTMTAYIVQISKGDAPHGSLEYRTIFLVGAVLFGMTLALNAISYRLARRYRTRFEA